MEYYSVGIWLQRHRHVDPIPTMYTKYENDWIWVHDASSAQISAPQFPSSYPIDPAICRRYTEYWWVESCKVNYRCPGFVSSYGSRLAYTSLLEGTVYQKEKKTQQFPDWGLCASRISPITLHHACSFIYVPRTSKSTWLMIDRIHKWHGCSSDYCQYSKCQIPIKRREKYPYSARCMPTWIMAMQMTS